MSIENSKYFAAGDAGGGPEKNNEQKQAPEKKEIKIDPNNFDEEEIEKIFKEPETTETTKTAKEEKPEEPQQTSEQPKEEKTPETQPTQRPEKSPENAKIKEQLHGLIEKAAVVFYSKEVDPNERIKLMGEYSAQITKLLNISSTTIYLTELITDNKKQSQFIDKISGVVDKEKQIPKPEAVEKAKEFIKSEEKKGKKSFWEQIGGGKTFGVGVLSILAMTLILILLGEFKLVEKAAGIGGGGGEKKEKKK